MLVLDANILIRAVLGRNVRRILEEYSARGARFYAPDSVFAEVARHLPALLEARNKPSADLPAALSYLQAFIEPVEVETYRFFEEDAKERLAGRDEEDWPVLATALALNCAIWTEDTDFFGIGAPVWTTSRIEIFLRSHLQPGVAEE